MHLGMLNRVRCLPAALPALPALLVLALAPSVGRADNIDLKLIAHGSDLIQECRKQGYKNVGTLKFRVKLPGHESGFGVEPLCSNMADRLENLLVLANDGEKPVGILHAAGEAAAARDARLSYRTPEGCKQLFRYTYDLAWGRNKVSPDAFFTGQVLFKDDLSSAEVVIECLDRSGPKLRRVLAFTVKTDRSVLADAGVPFQLDRRARESKAPARLDEAAAAAALARRKEIVPASSSSKQELLHVSVLVNDKEVPIRGTSSGQAQGVLPRPEPGQRVWVRLKNVSPSRLGVLLRVGGRNTIGEQIDEGPRCRRWVLEPAKERLVKGYYTGERLDNVIPFKLAGGLHGELAPSLQNLVDVQVYVASDQEARKGNVSLRGLSAAERKGSKEWTFKMLHSKLQARAGLKRATPRGMEPEDLPGIVEEALQNATFAENLRLRFEAE